ncbi:MAG: thiamine phosphate synthase, partial [Thauera sp.]
MSETSPGLRASSLRGLYAVTPDEPDPTRLLARVEQVLAGRPALLQYRNKTADAALRRAQARALQALCRAAGVPFVLNDD